MILDVMISWFVDFFQVKGKDQVGATMDFMELERQRGITIQSLTGKTRTLTSLIPPVC